MPLNEEFRARPNLDRRRVVQRPSPARPRGAGSRPQAARHVHRLHRHPRAHAVPLGDHRQRRRRGAGRRLQARPGDPAPGRFGRGPRRRPRHPGRHRAAHRSLGRRGGLHPSCTRAASSAEGRTSPRVACTAWALSVVNALSSRLDVVVDRSPATWAMSFQRGAPGVFDGDGPTATFTEKHGSLTKVGRVKKGVTGTRIRFWPDRQTFTKDAAYAYDELVTRARQTSFIVPGLEITIRDERGAEPVEETFRHDGGIAEFCDFLATDEKVTEILRLQGDGPVHRDRAGARRRRPHDPAGRRARAGCRRRAAVGQRLRHRGPLVRQRHRDRQGRHARRRVRASADQDVQRRGPQHPRADEGRRGRPASRTTSSKG